MQTTIQHQTMENIHRLFQLSTISRHCGRKNILLSRWYFSRFGVNGTDSKDHEANRRTETSKSTLRVVLKKSFSRILTSLFQISNFLPSDQGLLCDLLWSDPDKEVQGWGENDRGVSYTFGSEVVAKFLYKHDLDLVCRAHQVVEDGYEFFAKRQLVTLFSAPNYCGEFDNAGAMMSVDETLMCSFQVRSFITLKLGISAV